MYDRLDPRYKGIIQIILGLTVFLFIVGLFPYWFALLASLLLIASGIVTAGFWDDIQKMIQKSGNKGDHKR
jgi:UDP-N-acetylmuramyl pentapeptide phosphotransferase/UDP-N-acetylglucosamine-1-phosphate transferase